MERAQLSTAQGKERPQLIAARERMHLSLEEVGTRVGVSKTTVYRWEKKGDIPQPYHLRKLCTLFGMTARELGFDERDVVDVIQSNEQEETDEAHVLAAFRQQFLISRLMRSIWNWPSGDARYQKLQLLIIVELEDNSMNDAISRRDALRFLALVPVDMLGLSQFCAVFKKGITYDDILKHCAAGVVACWYLRKGKELVFAEQTVSAYIPTLKAMAQAAPPPQRKAAADLLAQCFLLKAPLAWNLTTPNDAISYAQQAETYAAMAGSRLLQVTALRTTAAAFCYANRWELALEAAEKAKYLLEQKEQSTPSRPAEELIPQLVSSYVYAGLATYQAYDGRKEDALHTLKKAHKAFFERPADEQIPVWIDHNIGNLLINDGETYMHLGLHKEAIISLEQISTQYDQDITICATARIEAFIHQVMAEVSRNDQPRDMQWCIDRWTQGIQGAKALQSQQRINEAIQGYAAMQAAWPGEKRIKDLRDYIVHW
jgi:transcriptional regulator with XRE-family HTH domain/tetratricopeptide (TPR) repeat protein